MTHGALWSVVIALICIPRLVSCLFRRRKRVGIGTVGVAAVLECLVIGQIG